MEATGHCILIGNSEVLLAAVCKSQCHTWNDTDITALISFRHKTLLAGDLNAKHTFWSSTFFNPSGVKLLNVLHTSINEFKISAPHCPTHYSPTEDGDMLNVVVRKNVRLSEVIVSDILDSDHLPVIFHLLNPIRSRYFLYPMDKFTDWERFQCLASELISPKILVNPEEEEANKAPRDFTSSVASVYSQ
jgi:hypothetical protein